MDNYIEDSCFKHKINFGTSYMHKMITTQII